MVPVSASPDDGSDIDFFVTVSCILELWMRARIESGFCMVVGFLAFNEDENWDEAYDSERIVL
jgi:hypothetical protein